MLSIFIELVFSYHLSIRKTISHLLILNLIVLVSRKNKILIFILRKFLTFVEQTLLAIHYHLIEISFISLSKCDCSLRAIILMLTTINIVELTGTFF